MKLHHPTFPPALPERPFTLLHSDEERFYGLALLTQPGSGPGREAFLPMPNESGGDSTAASFKRISRRILTGLILCFFLRPGSLPAGQVEVRGALEWNTGDRQSLDWLHFEVRPPGNVSVEAFLKAAGLDRCWLVLAPYREDVSWVEDCVLVNMRGGEAMGGSGDFTLPYGRWVAAFLPATTMEDPEYYISPWVPPFLFYGYGAGLDAAAYWLSLKGDIEALELREGRLTGGFDVTYYKEPAFQISVFHKIAESSYQLGWKAVQDREYRVEHSADLKTWVEMQSEIKFGDAWAFAEIQIPEGGAGGYYRVKTDK